MRRLQRRLSEPGGEDLRLRVAMERQGDRERDQARGGVLLTAATLGTTHAAYIESRADWLGGTREGCFAAGTGETTPTPVEDLAMRANYSLFGLSPGQSKTLKFEYGRM